MTGEALVEPSSRRGLVRREGRLLTPGRLVVPSVCVAVVVAVWVWIASSDLDFTESGALSLGRLLDRTWNHLEITAVATVIVIAIAVPLGILLTRPRARRVMPVVLAIANVGQAIPSIGLIVLLTIPMGVGFRTVLLALVVYAILPVLRNTMVGLQQVDRALIEAGRGMGMSTHDVLWKIEMRLAVPVIVAGVRVALVLLVGTAALGAFVNVTTLGDTIITGIKGNRAIITVTGAALTAVLALLIDWLAGVTEDVLRPRGLR